MIKLPRPQAKDTLVPSARSLLWDSSKLFLSHWRLLVGLTIILAVPSSLLRVADPTQDVTAAYLSLAAVIMNLALIWTISELEDGRRPRIKEAYYHGAASIVPFMLVIVVLTLQLAPFALGFTLFETGTLTNTVAVSPAEIVLLAIVWLILSLPTLYWLTRYLLAIFAAASGQTPLQALRTSRRLVRGRSWRVLLRQVVIVVLTLLVLSVPAAALSLAGQWQWLNLVLPVFATVVVLPLAYIYLYKLYRSLH